MVVLNKKTPSDLSTVGRYIDAIGGTYMVVTGTLAKYQCKNRGLHIEVEIASLEKHKEDFNASFKISPKVNKSLSALSKSKQDVTFCSDESRKRYLVTNQHINIPLKHVDVNLMMPTIAESIKGAEPIGPLINISSRNEIGITGRERSVSVVVRSDMFTGIINPAGEYFFDPDHREEAGSCIQLFRSCFFLKIGKERFKLQIYRKENRFLLLTSVSIGTGIECKMLETLIKK